MLVCHSGYEVNTKHNRKVHKVLDRAKTTLKKLRGSFNTKADRAYRERDAEGASTAEQAYAAGEGHAYGDASDGVRAAENEKD